LFSRLEVPSVKLTRKIAWGLANYSSQEFENEEEDIEWILKAVSVLIEKQEVVVQTETCAILTHL
jgi:hypothetical protein